MVLMVQQTAWPIHWGSCSGVLRCTAWEWNRIAGSSLPRTDQHKWNKMKHMYIYIYLFIIMTYIYIYIYISFFLSLVKGSDLGERTSGDECRWTWWRTCVRPSVRVSVRVDGRVTYEWTDVCVRVDGRVSVRTCVDTFTRHVRAHVRK